MKQSPFDDADKSREVYTGEAIPKGMPQLGMNFEPLSFGSTGPTLRQHYAATFINGDIYAARGLPQEPNLRRALIKNAFAMADMMIEYEEEEQTRPR